MFSSMKSSKNTGGGGRGKGELEDVSKKSTNKLLAWEDGGVKMTKSLGRDASRLYTSTTSSSDDDSDSSSYEENRVEEHKEEEVKKTLEIPSSKTRSQSLSRTDYYNTRSVTTSFVPVVERSAAYRELVLTSSYSQPSSRTGTSGGPRMRNHVSSSRVIEANPFYQQDRAEHQALKPSTSVSTLDTVGRPKSSSICSTSSSSSVASPGRSGIPTTGMSVQNRIKIWREKEEIARNSNQQQQQQQLQASKLQNRKSLQQLNFTAVNAGGDEEEEEVREKERGAQSDGEVAAKGTGKAADGSQPGISDRSNEILDDIVGTRAGSNSSTSSSSLSSDNGDNGSSGDSGVEKKGKQKKSKGKQVSADAKDKHEGKKKAESNKKRGWNPLSLFMKGSNGRKQSSASSTSSKDSSSRSGNKRPHTKPRAKSLSNLKKENETPLSADDVFSPINHTNGTSQQFNGIEEDGNEEREATTTSEEEVGKETTSEKSSADEAEASPSISVDASSADVSEQKEGRSISSDIRSIINSLGSSEDSPQKDLVTNCTILEDQSASDEDEIVEMSSLDVAKVGRQTLKRRASDSVKSLAVLKKAAAVRKGSLSPCDDSSESVVATPLIHGDAVWDRVALDGDELSFSVGEEVEVLDMTDDVWWYGSVKDKTGWFPASFVRLRVGQTSESEDTNNSSLLAMPTSSPKSMGACTKSEEVPSGPEDGQRHPTPESASQQGVMAAADEEASDTVSITIQKGYSKPRVNTVHRRMTIRRRDSIIAAPRKLTPKEVRGKIVEEILNTEKAYVQQLEDIIEGYLKRCREYIGKLFTEDQLEVIFSNVEQVYEFQRDFLSELQARVDQSHLDQSCIGEVFVLNKHEFRVYSNYCNNHPNAVNEMNSLQKNEQYALFFESCRLLRNLQDISLEGFLLTPVQKICKYPLQLSELVKYTSEDHPDYPHVVAAQGAMKEVALLINEQKRRIENMGKIGAWQKSIEGWKGPDVLEHSSELIHQGELQKISKGHSQERSFFLFDHQLIYCRKDTIGAKLVYKGRFDLDRCEMKLLEDGQALHNSNPVKNGWRVNNSAKDDKSYIIYAKTPEIKKEWMRAFEREKEMVKKDRDLEFNVPLKMKMAAVTLSCSSTEARRRKKTMQKRHIAISESVDSVVKHKLETSGGVKRLTAPPGMTNQVASSPQMSKKQKGGRKKKLNSVSSTSGRAVY